MNMIDDKQHGNYVIIMKLIQTLWNSNLKPNILFSNQVPGSKRDMTSSINSPWLPNVLHCKVNHMCQRNYHHPLLMRNSWTNVVILLRYIFDVVLHLFSGSGISLGGGGITGVCGFMLVHGIGLSLGRCCNHFLVQLMFWLMMIDDFLFFRVLYNIMANEYVSDGYKDRLRVAARSGRDDGVCHVRFSF